MKIKLCTDSTADLSPEQIREHDIHVFPLGVVKEGKAYRDRVDITPDEICDHVDNGGALCSTSANNVDDYDEKLQEFSPAYDAVIIVTIGSKFSTCYQNAMTAAKGYQNVYVVDSANLSTGQGLVVMLIARLIREGKDIDTILAEVDAALPRVEASFILDQLTYMKKGGRCSSVTLLGANLLKIKPCIKVKDGAMGVSEKYRGQFGKCLEGYIKERLEGRDDLDTSLIFITHSRLDPRYVEQARALIDQYQHFDEVVETEAGCTVTCHCGPGTLGILFMHK